MGPAHGPHEGTQHCSSLGGQQHRQFDRHNVVSRTPTKTKGPRLRVHPLTTRKQLYHSVQNPQSPSALSPTALLHMCCCTHLPVPTQPSPTTSYRDTSFANYVLCDHLHVAVRGLPQVSWDPQERHLEHEGMQARDTEGTGTQKNSDTSATTLSSDYATLQQEGAKQLPGRVHGRNCTSPPCTY